MKVSSTGKRICSCGWDLTPFSPEAVLSEFTSMNWNSVHDLAHRFVHNPDPSERGAILDFLTRRSQEADLRLQCVSCAAFILRDFGDMRSVRLLRSLRGQWPFNPFLRYELANSLDLTGTGEDHLEAFKQRILGTKLEMSWWQGKDKRAFEKVLQRHLHQLEGMQAYIEGQGTDPTERVRYLREKAEDAETETETYLDTLAELDRIADLPATPAPEHHDITCVLDTNALTSRHVSWLFPVVDVGFAAPTEVLLELSNWRQVESIPLSLDVVEILDVLAIPPPEIEEMFSERKGRATSRADKMVATLAIQLEADAIVSDDRDLWDGGLANALEKNLDHRIDIIGTREFVGWLKRHGYDID